MKGELSISIMEHIECFKLVKSQNNNAFDIFYLQSYYFVFLCDLCKSL